MTIEQFSSIGIDTQTVQYLLEWGYSVVMFSWCLGYVVGIAVKSINKA